MCAGGGGGGGRRGIERGKIEILLRLPQGNVVVVVVVVVVVLRPR